MVDRKDIQATCDAIVREFDPLKVILFGSYAYGTPTEDSDVDLLVVMPIPPEQTRQKGLEMVLHLPRRFRMDLMVRSPEEIVQRIAWNDWFLKEVMEKGCVLYDATDARVGAEGGVGEGVVLAVGERSHPLRPFRVSASHPESREEDSGRYGSRHRW